MSMAVREANSASLEPSVANRIFVGKMLTYSSPCSFFVSRPRSCVQLYRPQDDGTRRDLAHHQKNLRLPLGGCRRCCAFSLRGHTILSPAPAFPRWSRCPPCRSDPI